MEMLPREQDMKGKKAEKGLKFFKWPSRDGKSDNCNQRLECYKQLERAVCNRAEHWGHLSKYFKAYIMLISQTMKQL